MNLAVVIGLVALALGVAAGFLVQLDPGYIRISWLNWLIETNVWIGFLLFLVFYFVFHILLQTLIKTLALKSGFRRWRRKAGHRKALRRTNRGLLEYAEGNWDKAKLHLASAAERTDTPLANYLAASEAASEMGDVRESNRLLDQAHQQIPEGAVAIELARARIQLARGDDAAATATLMKLRSEHPKHPQVLRLLAKSLQRQGDWRTLGELLPDLARHGAVDNQQYADLQHKTWSAILKDAIQAALRQPNLQNPTGQLNETWDHLPSSLQGDPELVAIYAEGLKQLKADGHAEKVLQKALKSGWDARLVRLYGHLRTDHPAQQLDTAEAWLRKHEKDPDLKLTIGRLALLNRDWEKARTQLQQSYDLRADPECAAELGRLLAAEGRMEQATPYFQASLKTVFNLPTLPQPGI